MKQVLNLHIMTKRIIYYLLIAFSSAYLTGCASPRKPVPMPPVAPAPSAPSIPGVRSDVTHKVGPGETLWRISKMYDVPVASIMSANRLEDKDDLKMGEQLRIPQAAGIKPVVTLYPSEKWRYIIIHHSGTEEGSALQFHRSHLKKGWDKGVGYHFVIDNDQGEKQDGQIETTPRWIKQEDGAHCKAGDMNTRGIGICLVGNFDSDRVSRKQMESLVYLVNKLRRNYNIPLNRIIAHGKVSGAHTHCPGKRFPWDEFMDRLRRSSND
jgi:N-acetylmuramoyl-L-alanine amidase